jgi:hypothetical protein
MEATLRASFVRDPSGKFVPNKGPFEPTLTAELLVFVDDQPFAGSGKVKLPQNSRATPVALADVTNEAIDSMLNDMARRWSSAGRDDGQPLVAADAPKAARR